MIEPGKQQRITKWDEMLRIDKAILDTSDVICSNISQLKFTDRGLLSQNILGQLRNFVEYVAIKAYSNGQDVDPNDRNLNIAALKDMRRKGNLRFLYKFHEMLQKSVSHYTVDRDGSERLMLKYYEHLLKIKLYLKDYFDLDVLENISDFPLNTDTELSGYYEKIAERIEAPGAYGYLVACNDRYYVQRVKPFFVNQKVYYEVTFTAANNNASKFDRVIAFTKHEIVDNYAIKFSMHNDTVRILDREMSILVIDEYEVSIRPCEWRNFSEIVGSRIKPNTNSNEYKELMKYLKVTKMPLPELVSSDQDYYDYAKGEIVKGAQSIKIFEVLDRCRQIIINNRPGANVLRYLLYKMNNRIIKQQYRGERCSKLSDLYLDYGCIPFDQMPYCSSLRQHNPKLYDLLESIPVSGREHELFARYIRNNTEAGGHLFTKIAEIENSKNIDCLIDAYNSALYCKHTGRRIEKYKDYLYIRSYVEDSSEIVKKLQELTSSGVPQYTASVDSWISRGAYTIDDSSKKEALRQMFAKSRVALIYGSAGTGKSTLIKHISNFWVDKDKVFLANTHPAVDNMRRKVAAKNCKYSTIAKFLSKRNSKANCDILFIDECSTVSNDDMRQILEKANFKLLVLVGDIYQIESIYFGNWFDIIRKFIPKTSIFELSHPFRTTNNNLITVWERVRNLDDAVLEPLVKNGYVARLNESIFERNEEDEIILCLNYDGLYGINNINRFLQNANPNKGVVWGVNTYKADDPILFNESTLFSPLIHNNSKGKIVDIRPEGQRIWFDVELDESINALNAQGYGFSLVGESKAGKSIISFSVNKYRNTDEDETDNDSTIVPFQVAYAVSIHKAQGLEYDSVKIVITNETEERITHSIFYTAITRAKKKLKIYWSPETEQSVLGRLEVKSSIKDACLLAQLSSLAMAD